MDFKVKKEVIVVAFSGGRTSAFMCWWLIKYMGHLYEFVFVYANTGLEHEKTLEFVDKVDKFLGLNLIWVEADIKDKRLAFKGSGDQKYDSDIALFLVKEGEQRKLICTKNRMNDRLFAIDIELNDYKNNGGMIETVFEMPTI